jgi:hypothetical protein
VKVRGEKEGARVKEKGRERERERGRVPTCTDERYEIPPSGEKAAFSVFFFSHMHIIVE